MSGRDKDPAVPQDAQTPADIMVFARSWEPTEDDNQGFVLQTRRQRDTFRAQHAADDNGDLVHNATLLAQTQYGLSAYENLKGRKRFVAKTRVPLLYEVPPDDESSDGFFVGRFYQLKRLGASNDTVDGILRSLESLSETESLSISVQYCQILEIRKLVGESLQLRGSMSRKEAAKGQALVRILNKGAATDAFCFEQHIEVKGAIPMTHLGGMANFLIESPASLRFIGLFEGQDEFALAKHSISRESIKCKHLISGVDAGGRERDPSETIFVLNVNELRRELKERNLPRSGRKKDLRYRLISSLASSPVVSQETQERSEGPQETSDPQDTGGDREDSTIVNASRPAEVPVARSVPQEPEGPEGEDEVARYYRRLNQHFSRHVPDDQ